VSWLQVAAIGVMDGAQEVLAVASTSLRLDGVGVTPNTPFTLNSVNWQANYLSGQGLRFTLASGDYVTAAQAQALLRALTYKNTADTDANLTDGARVLTVSAQDAVGNITTTPAKAVLGINVQNPAAAASNPLTTTDANGDGVLGDQFTVRFSELVRVDRVTNTANWSVSGGLSLGTGFAVQALNTVTIDGVAYASEYRVTGGTGYTYTTGTVLTIGSANVVDTAGAAAGANVSFTMTDIVAPGAPTPPLTISGDNFINSNERAEITNIVFTHGSSSLGDVMKLYRDGVLIKSVNMVVGSSNTTIQMSSDDWGTDGGHSFSARIEDAAGNLGVISSSKIVNVDTGIAPGVAIIQIEHDAGGSGVADAGDRIIVTFNEAAQLTAANLNSAVFGTGATVAAIGAAQGNSASWQITLGVNPTLTGGQIVEFSGLIDVAGNSGSTGNFVVAADIFNSPGKPVIGNVATNNVLSSNEASQTQVISVGLSQSKAGDVVKLYMDGVQVGSQVVSTNGQGVIEFNMTKDVWGADGNRTLTASVQRESGTVVFGDFVRTIQVSAEASNWSMESNIVWFDPDRLIGSYAIDEGVATWAASASNSVATQNVASSQFKLIRGVNGHAAVLSVKDSSHGTAEGMALKSYMNFSKPTDGFSLVTGTSPFYTLIANRDFGSPNQFNSMVVWGMTDSATPGLISGAGPSQFSVRNNRDLVLDLAFVGPGQFPNSALANVNYMYQVQTNPGVRSVDFLINGTAVSINNALTGTGLDTKYSASNDIAGQLGNAFWGFNGTLQDVVFAMGVISTARRQEMDTYVAEKNRTVGTEIKPSALAGTYDLSLSNAATVLLDDVLTLNSELGVASDTVTIAGSDYVNSGASADTVRAKDLAFRYIDGGLGFDTFALHSQFTGGVFNLSDYVSNARGISGGLSGTGNADDIRVNTNGYHKLLGFEKLDFSQSTVKQTITVAAVDVDQLAEKNLVGDPNRAANTSNLYAELGSNDYLVVSGFANTTPLRGFWKDANGVVYDRKYSVTGGTIGAGDTANLFVRGGDDAPELGNTSTAGTYAVGGGSTTINLSFSESMVVNALTAGEFSITHSGGTVTATSASMTASGLTVGYSGGQLSGVLRLQYSGTQLVDLQGDQLRFKDISLGTSSADTLDGSARSTHQALIGNAGNDVISGGSGDDLIMGGAGNDNLMGGLGADIFRFIKFEAGQDTVTDFNVTQGDKLDLRSLLSDTGLTLDNQSLYLSLVDGVGQKTLKVDTLGTGNFSSADMTVVLTSPQGINDNLATLIDQKVFLVV
jgi:hypothetical protein